MNKKLTNHKSIAFAFIFVFLLATSFNSRVALGATKSGIAVALTYGVKTIDSFSYAIIGPIGGPYSIYIFGESNLDPTTIPADYDANDFSEFDNS